jgi:hypothetical protein
MSVKNAMYVIFFTNQGPAIPIAVPKDKYVSLKVLKAMSFIN